MYEMNVPKTLFNLLNIEENRKNITSRSNENSKNRIYIGNKKSCN